jgi:phage terminase Nu1 subunit (DNA packaging protein)
MRQPSPPDFGLGRHRHTVRLLFIFMALAVTDLRSLADTAAFFSVSQPTVRRWIEAGCPVAEKGSSGTAYKMDLSAVANWRAGQRQAEDLAAQTRAERDAQLRLELLGDEALTANDDAAALTWRQRTEALQGEVARTKLAQLRRELVAAEPVSLQAAEIMAQLKTRLRQIPDVAAPELSLTETQSGRLAALIDDALTDAADALEAMLTDEAA